ncbi:MAG: hypothetical protein KDC47_11430, partial [Flavobacteriaceae bacterium]|nr:hypothetical protein [Flavobacteriaceae bacterium]
GISWVALDPANKDGWGRAQKAVPFVEPHAESIGAGLTKEKPVWMMGYRYPMITVYAKTKADEVYAVTKAIAETYDVYKSAAPIMPRWDVKKAGTPPMDAAFHDGAIRYLKEKGIWTADHQKWQDGALKRQKMLQAAWKEMMAKEPAAKGADTKKLQTLWVPRRAEVLKSL